ncbi:MAG: hypothetical protein M3P18_13995 [Actinomycetota bacterium]|nr:hypothetical protein [Actinomycetota bacterium]
MARIPWSGAVVHIHQRQVRRRPTLAAFLVPLVLILTSTVLLTPAIALAGPFAIAWSGDPTAHGFVPKTDAGAPCAYPGAAASAQAGTFPSFGACFFIFNAPASATITSVHATGRFNKASSSANLCAQSFADVGSPAPLNLCTGGDFDQTIPVASGRWVEIGLRNKFDAPISVSTANANNVNLSSGAISLDDPSLPAASLAGQIPAWVAGDAISLAWSASDPESSIAAANYQADGAAAVGLLGDGCQDVFVCGTTRGGGFTLSSLSQAPDGPHTVILTAASAGGTASAAVQFATDHTPPAFIGDPSIDRSSRTISWFLSDQTSGIASIDEDLNGVQLTPTLSKSAAATWLATTTVASGTTIGSATLTATIRDAAGNTTTRAYTIPADPPPATALSAPTAGSGTAETGALQPAPADNREACRLTAKAAITGAAHRKRSTHLRVLAGHLIRVDGTLSCATTGGQPLTIILVNAAHPRLTHAWRTTTRTDGAYTVWLRPRISGRISVGFPGAPTLQSTSASAREIVRVVPIIHAHFTARQTPAGYVNPTVHGTFLPSPGATATLAWQARVPGGRWQLIGTLAATVRPKSDGTFVRRLHLGPIDPRAQLRLIYLGIAGGPYATAASRPQSLR